MRLSDRLRSESDTWLDKAEKEINAAGGQILGEGFISEALTGRASLVLAFEL